MSNRSTLMSAAIVGLSICLVPIIGFVLYSLWPERILVSWLILGFAGLVGMVLLGLRIIKVATAAKVQLLEEGLRPGRLHAHERLIGQDKRYDADRMAQEPYVQALYQQLPYTGLPSSYYDGLQPLKVQKDDQEW